MLHLVGTAEIRQMLGGVSRTRVHQLAKRPDFPRPVAVLLMGNVWDRAEVVEWIRRNGRAGDD